MSFSAASRDEAQTHYSEPFGSNVFARLSAWVIVLGIISLFVGLLPGVEAGGLFLATLKVVGLVGTFVTLTTNPSFGLPRRVSRHVTGDDLVVYTIRPLFARKQCEWIGGFRHSNLHGNTLDYNKPYVVYAWLGLTCRVRWESAILVVNW
jgi:predicted anti-sigma-YlaC factor YlaD